MGFALARHDYGDRRQPRMAAPVCGAQRDISGIGMVDLHLRSCAVDRVRVLERLGAAGVGCGRECDYNRLAGL